MPDLLDGDLDTRMTFATRARLAALRRWHEERTPASLTAYYAAYHAWLRCYEAILAETPTTIAA